MKKGNIVNGHVNSTSVDSENELTDMYSQHHDQYADNNIQTEHINNLKQQMKYLNCARNLRRFRRCFVDLHKLSSLNISELNEANPRHMDEIGEKYDKLIELMQNDIIIRIFSALSKVLFSPPNNEGFLYKLTGRELLTVFSFAGFPEFSLEFYRHRVDKTSIQGRLHLTAKKVLQLWMKIILKIDSHKNVLKLTEYLNLFTFYYVIHMNNDRMHKINQLFLKWYNEEKEKEDAKNNESLDHKKRSQILRLIENRQKVTLRDIKKFYENFDDSILEKFKTMVDENRDIVFKAFWDRIQEDLESGNSSAFIRVLAELKAELLGILPESKKKREIMEGMKDKFDLPFIKSMVDNKVYGSDNFYGFCNYVLSIFEAMQAPSRTPVMKREWDNLVDKVNEHTDMEKCREYLKFMFKELELLKDSVTTIKVLDSLGVNVFAL